MRMLVVEDEFKMASLIRRGLVEEGYAADVARTGEEALWMARATPYDAIVLDLMLPGRDGQEVCRELRESGVWSPILMLTARDGVEDVVQGLDSGADDYLTKPFSLAAALPSGPPSSRSGRSGWIPPPARRGAPRPRSSCRRRSSRCSRRSCAAPVPSSRGSSCWSTLGTTATRIVPTSWTSTSAICGRRSTARSGGSRSRRSGERATGCAATAAPDDAAPRRRVADPPSLDPRLHDRDC